MGPIGQHETHLKPVLICSPFFVSILQVSFFFDGLSSSYQTKLFRSPYALTYDDQLSQQILAVRFTNL